MTIDASAILHVTTAVTKQWTKQRKAEERGRRSRANRANMYSGRVNFTEVAARIIPGAYNHTSGDGKYPVKKRQMYYASRDKFRELTGRTIKADYFTQTVLRRYLNTHPETADWKIVADARGHLIIPNTGRKVNVPLGVLEIGEHLRKAGRVVQDNVSLWLPTEWPSLEAGQRYQAVVFIEKEGFNELMEAAQIAERYNVAILSAKGQSTEAARLFVDQVCYEGGVPLFILRDFDKYGFIIATRLTTVNEEADEDLRLYEFENDIDVTDLGLRLADVKKWELEWAAETVECQRYSKKRCTCFRCAPLCRYEYDITEDEYKFLSSGKRVELNALTSPQFVAYLEAKPQEHGIHENWMPEDDDVLARAYRRALVVSQVNRDISEAEERAKETADSMEVPEDLRGRLQEALKIQRQPWDKVIYGLAKEDIEE